MEGSYLSANFFREIVAAESFSYDPSRPKPQFVTLTGEALALVEGGTGCCRIRHDAVTLLCFWPVRLLGYMQCTHHVL
jgi:hypothetical protein